MSAVRVFVALLLLFALAACTHPLANGDARVQTEPGPGHVTVTWNGVQNSAVEVEVARVELTDGGAPLDAPQVLATLDGSAVSYRDDDVAPEHSYAYSVAVRFAGGSAYTLRQEGATRAIVPLTVVRAEAVAGDEVMVVLSKPVEVPDALTLARYELAPEVEILDATLGETATEVHLHTAPMESIAYTLTVRDLRDADGYGLLADPDQATFEGKWLDSDGDGLHDGQESAGWTVRVALLDGATDAWPVTSDPHATDSDGDGLSDAEERALRSDPRRADSDGDGLDDADEVNLHGTSPTMVDSDDDGVTDGLELFTYGTDPMDPDTDGDGLDDGTELGFDGTTKTDPLDPDTDGDGIPDGEDDDPTGANSVGKAFARGVA